MSGIEITDVKIYNHASNPAVYQRGLTYFTQGRVFDLSYDENSRSVYASVEGNDVFYDVNITFSQAGTIASSYCECSAFESYAGGCKHIVAVLKEAQRNLRYVQAKVPRKNDPAISQIFSYFSNLYEEPKKEPVHMELTLHVEKESYGLSNSLELRVGAGRMYIVRDIKSFVTDMEKSKTIEFGKNFIFDPAHYGFSDTDRAFMELLNEILENENARNTRHSYYSEPASSFKGKRLYLTDPYLRRLFDILHHSTLQAVVFGTPYYHVKIIDEDLPLDFILRQDTDRDIVTLAYSKPLKLILLTKKADYFLIDGVIYHPSPAQGRNFSPFYQAFAGSNRNQLSIPKADMGRFVSEVLPFLQKAAQVTIDSSLEESFLKEDLHVKIFFDRYEDGISAHIEFHYGDEVVIPFTPGRETSSSNKIIIRNPVEEQKILDFFEKYEFKVEKEKVYLLQENKIYDFIYTALPSLQELADMYYSEGFKRLKVTQVSSFSGGVRLTDHSLLEFTFHFDGVDPKELAAIFYSLREKKKYFRLKDGSFLSLDQPEFLSMAEIIDQLDIRSDELNNSIIHLPKYRAMVLDSLLRETNLQGIERNLAFKQMVQNIKEPQDMDFTVPPSLKSILRDYQKTGFKWLKTLISYGFGGILADDMGLGKTLQVIAFVLSERSEASKPALVIAPTSLVYNWQDEVRKFVPSMKVSIISGVHSERLEQLKEIDDSDIVITSYALIRRDVELYSGMEFSYCFLDEAQHIKNPNTINAKSVKQIKARGYFALTGTPLENSLTELWSIFDFIMPGYLLSHAHFVKKYETPIVKNQDDKVLHDLGRLIRPFILRRMKKDVLKELPEKIESRMTAEMTDPQKKVYMAYLQQARNEIAAELEINGFSRSHIKILAVLTRLRQICCHPSLFLENYEGESGKVSLLMEVLTDALEGGHRVLIFSQFTSMLQIIAEELEGQNIEYYYLDGSVKAEVRGDMVKSFNKGNRSVFLISLKAGGTGLNLTGADMVIHFDPWWNPAVEDQASDRAYRIGQNNVVQVMKLITQGTIEEKIYELQQKKRVLIDAVIQPGETLLSKMTETEIRELFEL